MRGITILIVPFLLLIVATVAAQDVVPARPQLYRQGDNLIADPTVSKPALWSLSGGATIDTETSRTDDGSGSVKLVTPIPNGSMVFSDYIPIQGGKTYTFGFSLKTTGGPTFVGGQISIHDRNKTYLRNLTSGRAGTTEDGQWQEVALPVFVPEEAAYVQVQAYKFENTQPGGQAWVDDFYLGEGIGLEQPPAIKRGFDGEHVRVDPLGNFEVKQNGIWTPFFPLCMYSDNSRDWSLYSRQGWNTIIWTGAAHQIQQAKEAVSDFNPDGMLAGFQISQYTFPAGWAYNDLGDLRSKLKEIFDQKLDDRLLLYYWDNENNHDQWQVPTDVIETIRSIDVDAGGRRLHPVYALQGEYNIARVHAAKGLVDVSGTYVSGTPDATNQTDGASLLYLDRLEDQVSPAAFAQFNDVTGAGEMRLRLYNSLILGARAMGFWRDCFTPTCQPVTPTDGRVDEHAWWPDFPNLRREVDQLLPVIREPHWTDWTARVDAPDAVRIGTRDHEGEGYVILANQTTQPQQVTVTFDELPFQPASVESVLDGAATPTLKGNTISIALPKIDIGSGTAVLRLVRAKDRN